jgi:hypothetical protein
MTRIFTPLFLVCVSLARAGNLLEQGDFAAGSEGGPPPAPWIVGQSRPDVNVVVENPPGSEGGGNWVHLVDDSPEDAAGVVQKFGEISSGRLSFRLHVVKSGAAIWFLLGGRELAAKSDAVISFKITSQGHLLVAQDGRKIANTAGGRAAFSGGQTHDLYCDFKTNGTGLDLEIGQKDGTVLFRGTSERTGPISAVAVRTHGEESGSDFYLTDLVLEAER